MNLADLGTILVSGLITGSIYASIAFALTLTYNVTRVVNLAQGEFYMLSPFLALFMMDEVGWALVPAVAASLIVTTLVAVAMYVLTIAPLRHTNEDNIILLTFGMISVLSGIVLVLFGAASRSFPAFSGLASVVIADVGIPPQGFWVVGATLVVLIAVWFGLTRTLQGSAMRAAADSPFAARAIGLRPRQLAVLAFGISGLLGAMTGVLAAPIAFVSYESGLAALAGGAIAAIVGGWGSYGGALVGAMTYGLTEAAAATYLPTVYGTAITVAIMLFLLLLRPQGLVRAKSMRVRRV